MWPVHRADNLIPFMCCWHPQPPGAQGPVQTYNWIAFSLLFVIPGGHLFHLQSQDMLCHWVPLSMTDRHVPYLPEYKIALLHNLHFS